MSNLQYPLNAGAAFLAILDGHHRLAQQAAAKLDLQQLQDVHAAAEALCSLTSTDNVSAIKADSPEPTIPPGVTISEAEFEQFVDAIELCNRAAKVFQNCAWSFFTQDEQDLISDFASSGFLSTSDVDNRTGKAKHVDTPRRHRGESVQEAA